MRVDNIGVLNQESRVEIEAQLLLHKWWRDLIASNLGYSEICCLNLFNRRTYCGAIFEQVFLRFQSECAQVTDPC